MYQTVFLKNKSSVIIVLMIFLVWSCTSPQKQSLPYYQTPDFTPLFLSKAEANEKITHRIGPFQAIDQKGNIVTESTLSGKIHVANFIFTRCGSICPIMTENLKNVANAFSKDTQVVLLSFSVTPWIDSVSRLDAFAKAHKLDYDQWYLLTGSQGAIYKLARQSYFAEEDLGYTRDSTEFLHTEHVLLVDRDRRLRGIYNGTLQLEMEQLVKDILVLKKEDLR